MFPLSDQEDQEIQHGRGGGNAAHAQRYKMEKPAFIRSDAAVSVSAVKGHDSQNQDKINANGIVQQDVNKFLQRLHPFSSCGKPLPLS